MAAATAGPAPLNEILLRHGLQFFDAPAHLILAHLLKGLPRSHNPDGTAFGIASRSASEGSAAVRYVMARPANEAGMAGALGLASWSGPARMQAMAKALTADDSLPLVASLTLQEHVADASFYRSVPPSSDEFSADEKPLVWEAEGWEDIG